MILHIMLKKGGYLWLVIGVLLILIGIASITRYLTDYSVLSPYGKGYVWGNLLMVFIGFIFCYFFYRARRAH